MQNKPSENRGHCFQPNFQENGKLPNDFEKLCRKANYYYQVNYL